MSVIRQGNWLGSMRVDVPHLRSAESSICNDFDLLAGTIIAGKHPLVVSGFYLITTGVTEPQSLQLQVANSVLMHFNASESGSMFRVQSDRANEVLNTTNTRIDGSWTPSQVNYVGLDLVRSADASTVDLVQFIDTTSLVESSRSVPLARTLDYRIIISTTDFSSNPNVAPLAKITLDPSGNIIAVEDARNIFGRLGSGGSVPDTQNAFPWPAGRRENLSGDLFLGGDKAVSSLKDWMDAAMTRMWELGGGQQWYSPTADRNAKIVRTGSTFTSSGEHFEWDGTNLHWKGLVAVFDNSTATSNTITDQTTDSAGLTDLVDGECVYVDLVRSVGSTLTAVKGFLATLGTPTVPGSRWVFAWRYGSSIFTRDHGWAVGSSFKLATVTVVGTVRLSATDVAGGSTPRVTTCESGTGLAIAGGLSRGDVGSGSAPDYFDGAGDLSIGGNDQDHNINLLTSVSAYSTTIAGFQRTLVDNRATVEVSNLDTNFAHPDNQIARFIGHNENTGLNEYAFSVDANGAIGFRNVSNTAVVTAGGGADTIATKLYFRPGDVSFPQPCVKYADGIEHLVSMNGAKLRNRWEANAHNFSSSLTGSYFQDFTGETPTGVLTLNGTGAGVYSGADKGGVFVLVAPANTDRASWSPSPDETQTIRHNASTQGDTWDYTFRAQLGAAVTAATSILMGWTGSGGFNGLAFRPDGQLYLTNNTGGQLAITFTPDTNYHVFRVTHSGSRTKVYIDGTLLLNDTTLNAGMAATASSLYAYVENLGGASQSLRIDKAFCAFGEP